MKKSNNKYRNNNNNYSTIYSLNYKFDSTSPAGKASGTALDLIKRYNELAKEAQSNGYYVEAEVYRQYAEHYRKIVTDINEKKNQNAPRQNHQRNEAFDNNQSAENTNANNVAELIDFNTEQKNEAPAFEKKSFTVIEIKQETSKSELIESSEDTKPKMRRAPRKKEAAV